MNLKQEEIYHKLVIEVEPLFKLDPPQIQEVLQLFLNRVNVRLQLKSEQVPFLERVEKSNS